MQSAGTGVGRETPSDGSKLYALVEGGVAWGVRVRAAGDRGGVFAVAVWLRCISTWVGVTKAIAPAVRQPARPSP